VVENISGAFLGFSEPVYIWSAMSKQKFKANSIAVEFFALFSEPSPGRWIRKIFHEVKRLARQLFLLC